MNEWVNEYEWRNLILHKLLNLLRLSFFRGKMETVMETLPHRIPGREKKRSAKPLSWAAHGGHLLVVPYTLSDSTDIIRTNGTKVNRQDFSLKEEPSNVALWELGHVLPWALPAPDTGSARTGLNVQWVRWSKEEWAASEGDDQTDTECPPVRDAGEGSLSC